MTSNVNVFSQFWKQTTSSRKQVAEESNSDSDIEETRKKMVKKLRKKSTNKRRKPRVQSQFEIHKTLLPKKLVVDDQSNPEIMCVELNFSPNDDNKEQLIAATTFFNSRNQKNIAQEEIPPYQYPAIRSLLQTKPNVTFDIHAQNDRGQARPQMEGVTRQHEERYMVEPEFEKGQRQCLYDDKCQGLRIINTEGLTPFILPEFFLPSEEAKFKKKGALPPERRMCIMCRRYEIQRALLSTRADAMAIKQGVTLQDYFNYTDMEGQYMAEHCICSSPNVHEGLLEPVVRHQLSSYKLKINADGKRYYDQWTMAYPNQKQQNFQ